MGQRPQSGDGGGRQFELELRRFRHHMDADPIDTSGTKDGRNDAVHGLTGDQHDD